MPATRTVLNTQHHYSSVDNKGWPKKLSKDNCNTVFSFLEQYSVLVCKQHCTAIINLDRHLQEQHKTLVVVRRQIVRYFLPLPTLNPSAIELLEQPAWLVQELGAPLDGMKCKACSFITINRGNMKTYYKTAHKLS